MTTRASEILRVQRARDAELTGRGQVVAVCDTGLDIGRLDGIHPAFAGKVRAVFPYGRSDWDDPDGHGTHVCGCIVGGGGIPEADGTALVGPASDAHLIVQSVFQTRTRPFGNRPTRMNRVLRKAYAAGARIHSNSWIQVRSGTRYTRTAREMDRFIYTHRDMTVVVAVGNESRFLRPGVPETGTIRSPGMTKNAIAVGASESHRPLHSRPYRHFFPDSMHQAIGDEILDDGWADGTEIVAPFSGRGPTAEGRIKPDLVAPGTAILSARSRRANVRSVWGAGTDPDFVFLGGTSSAAPLAAGCAAVVRQFAVERLAIAEPSAALVKALLVNGAQGLEGRSVPDAAQGWGRIDLSAAVLPAEAFELDEMAVRAEDEGAPLPASGAAARFLVRTQAAGPFRVTLTWTDPPGGTLASDLDLIVKLPGGEERHGNCAPGVSGFDRKNNVENVRLEACPAGEVHIAVRAYRLDGGPQSFALVATGAFGDEELEPV